MNPVTPAGPGCGEDGRIARRHQQNAENTHTSSLVAQRKKTLSVTLNCSNAKGVYKTRNATKPHLKLDVVGGSCEKKKTS